MHKRHLLLAGMLALTALPSGTRAACIAFDQLSGYPSGSLEGQGLGYGWTGNWFCSQNVFTAVPGSDLAYSGVSGATGLGRVSPVRGAGVYRAVPTISSGTLYFGALVKLADTSAGIRIIDMGGTEGGSVLVGQYNSNPYGSWVTTLYLDLRPAGLGVAGQVGQNTGISVTTQAAYWVTKIEFDANGTLDDVRFFVNPADAYELENNIGVDARINDKDIGSLNTFSAYVDAYSGFDFDEVRLATSAADMFGPASEPVPTLGVRREATEIVLTWSTNFTGFSLEYATNLAAVNWLPATPAPGVVNGQNAVTNQCAGTAAFYRLRKP